MSKESLAPQSLTRARFITRFMRDLDIDYLSAVKTYECMVSQIEDAIVAGEKVHFAKVGAIVPVWQEPKVIHMGFQRKGKVISKDVKREYVLGRRIKYKFSLFKEFMSRHRLNWFGS